jgi:sensor histidine kinase YesM
MIIQIHVENALKHGLLPRDEGGMLQIRISIENEYILITVSDNGIGREQAAINVSHSTGRGMRILAQLFETYNKHNKLPLRQEIEDLTDEENNPCGTQVRIFVPIEFNENIY